MKTRLLLAAAALLAIVGCSSDNKPASTLTEHQRDSVLAKSSLPGAFVVGRALNESDRATRQAANMDSLSR